MDHITDQLNKLGPGSHLYKVDFLLIELIKFGFPLDFNPQFDLACDAKNHALAVVMPRIMRWPLNLQRMWMHILRKTSSLTQFLAHFRIHPLKVVIFLHL